MNSFNSYIHLQSTTMNPADLTNESYAEARKTWLCTGCMYPRPDVERVDAYLQNRSLQGPLNVVNGTGVSLARLSFLLRLGEERVRRYLRLGKVFGPNGSPLADWVTYLGNHRLIVRGSTEHAGNRVCPECGRNCYFGMHPRYLYPQPRTDVEIFDSDLGLIIPEHIATEVGIGGKIRHYRDGDVIQWRDEKLGVTPRRLLVESLKVLEEPKDGLPPLGFWSVSDERSST